MNFEEAGEETKQLLGRHGTLAAELQRISSDENMTRIPVAVKRLIDNGIEPIVVAKTMLVGNRQGNVMYNLASASVALSSDERVCEQIIGIAAKPLPKDVAAVQLTVGASWVAQQFGCDVSLLLSLVQAVSSQVEGQLCAIDLALSTTKGKENIMQALQMAGQPEHAPLEMTRPTDSGGLF